MVASISEAVAGGNLEFLSGIPYPIPTCRFPTSCLPDQISVL